MAKPFYRFSLTKNGFFDDEHSAPIVMRVGDFYEIYQTAALQLENVLGVKICTINANLHVHAIGFPFHAIDTYMKKLLTKFPHAYICHVEQCKLIVDTYVSIDGNGNVQSFNMRQENNNNINNQNSISMETKTFDQNFNAINICVGVTYFVLRSGALCEGKMDKMVHDYDTNKTMLTFVFCNGDTIEYETEQLNGIVFKSEADYREGKYVENTLYTPDMYNVNGKRLYRKNRNVFVFKDGAITPYEIIPNRCVVECGKNIQFVCDAIRDTDWYVSAEECSQWNRTLVRNVDGSEKLVGGEWLDVLVTPEQQKLVDEFKNLMQRMKDAHLRVGYDYCNDVFEFVNGDKAYIQYYDEGIDEGETRLEWPHNNDPRVIYSNHAVYGHGEEYNVIRKA